MIPSTQYRTAPLSDSNSSALLTLRVRPRPRVQDIAEELARRCDARYAKACSQKRPYIAPLLRLQPLPCFSVVSGHTGGPDS
jgi:hypothetical protein